MSKPPLRKVLPAKKKRKAIANAIKANEAIRKWVNSAMFKQDSDLFTIAKASGLKPQQFLQAVADNSDLHKLLFGTMAVEAELLVRVALQKAAVYLNSSDTPQPVVEGQERVLAVHPDSKLRWAQYITKLARGGFNPKEAGITLIANLIPDLPIAIQREIEKAAPRVVEIEREETLEDYLPHE